MKRKLRQSRFARIMRQATAYARLSAKADRAGERRQSVQYQDKYFRLRAQALRLRERGQ